MSISFILEAMARAEKLVHSATFRSNEPAIIGDAKFEITDLCEIFLGPMGRRSFALTVGLYLYGTLWAYSTVFANSMTANLDAGEHSYLIYLTIYVILVVPPSCMELSEQAFVQVILALCRGVMLLFMVGSVLFDMYSGTTPYEIPAVVENNQSHLSGVHILIPIALFALIFHESIPAIAEPVKDKHLLTSMFNTGLIVCAVGYYAIALIVSTYFNVDLQSTANLMWKGYGNTDPSTFGYTIKHIVRYFVLLFPALDVASLYPLTAVVLGNNLFSAFYGYADEAAYDQKTKIFFRLLAAVPPLIGAFFISSLGNITNFTGITGFGIVFIFPSLLAYYSHDKLLEKGCSPNTIYSNVFTSRPCVILLFGFGICISVYTTYCLISYGPPDNSDN
jgi:amino acid permease